MSRKKHRKDDEAREKKVSPDETPGSDQDAGGHAEDVDAGGAWESTSERLHWKTFPGEAHTSEAKRVAFAGGAYADVVAHAREDLSAEICGVLVGRYCEDEEGPWTFVEASIAGEAADSAGTHVTYTQETWNKIHEVMEDKYKKLAIVGWYHSHPGFGVEFSDMDLFIQENFFSQDGQVALVTDPLGGEEAACVNGASGLVHVSRIWIDGREKKCHVPLAITADDHEDDDDGSDMSDPKRGSKSSEKRLRSIEERMTQLLTAMEDMRTSLTRFLMFMGMLVTLAVLVGVGAYVWKQYRAPMKPPRPHRVEVPVKIGDRYFWTIPEVRLMEVPEQMRELMEEKEQVRQRQRTAATQQAAGKASDRGRGAIESQPARKEGKGQ